MDTWKFPSYIFCIKDYFESVFLENLGNVTDFYLILNLNFISIDDSNFFRNLNINQLSGVILKNNTINQGTLINLLQYYLILNDYYVYESNLYKRIDNTYISFILVDSIENELYNNFQERVIMFYTSFFENYFDGFDFNYLIRTQFIKSKNLIFSIKDISTNKIKPDFSIIEFKDGIYFIKYDRFIAKKDPNLLDLKLKLKNISTLKYFNKNYNWVRKNEPRN
jgi:hypothetical protein